MRRQLLQIKPRTKENSRKQLVKLISGVDPCDIVTKKILDNPQNAADRSLYSSLMFAFISFNISTTSISPSASTSVIGS